MAVDRNILSHSIAGNVGTSLVARGIRWYRWGDAIAYTYKSLRDYARPPTCSRSGRTARPTGIC